MLPASSTPNVQAPAFTSALLGRDVDVVYGERAEQLLGGSTILVTGAAGSIGSELVRQVRRLQPAKVYLLDQDESALHALQLELCGHGLFDDDTVVLCDIRDAAATARAVEAIKPDMVLHAAALKHLPLLERYPAEGIKTNVLGTLNVVRAAAAAGVGTFVNVSTDKAARPTSVLGTTKRLAELVVAAHAAPGFRVASVRFGNVLGSRGSFLQSMASQVDRGQWITVTDPAVTRYFMTIPEAAGLVIEASVLAGRGELYVLDMGEPVRIMDLVTKYLELTGLSCPGISFTGLRPGEKLHETLLDSAEIGQTTSHPKITVVSQRREVTELVLDLIPGLRASLDAPPEELAQRLVSIVQDQCRTGGPSNAGSGRGLAAV